MRDPLPPFMSLVCRFDTQNGGFEHPISSIAAEDIPLGGVADGTNETHSHPAAANESRESGGTFFNINVLNAFDTVQGTGQPPEDAELPGGAHGGEGGFPGYPGDWMEGAIPIAGVAPLGRWCDGSGDDARPGHPEPGALNGAVQPLWPGMLQAGVAGLSSGREELPSICAAVSDLVQFGDGEWSFAINSDGVPRDPGREWGAANAPQPHVHGRGGESDPGCHSWQPGEDEAFRAATVADVLAALGAPARGGRSGGSTGGEAGVDSGSQAAASGESAGGRGSICGGDGGSDTDCPGSDSDGGGGVDCDRKSRGHGRPCTVGKKQRRSRSKADRKRDSRRGEQVTVDTRYCQKGQCVANRLRLAQEDAWWNHGAADRWLRAKRRTWGAESSHELTCLREELKFVTHLVNRQARVEAQRACLPAQLKELKLQVLELTLEARELRRALEERTVEAADWEARYKKEWEGYKEVAAAKKDAAFQGRKAAKASAAAASAAALVLAQTAKAAKAQAVQKAKAAGKQRLLDERSRLHAEAEAAASEASRSMALLIDKCNRASVRADQALSCLSQARKDFPAGPKEFTADELEEMTAVHFRQVRSREMRFFKAVLMSRSWCIANVATVLHDLGWVDSLMEEKEF